MIITRSIAAITALGLIAGCSGPAGMTNVTPSRPMTESRADSVAPDLNARPVLYVGDILGKPGLGQILVYSPAIGGAPTLLRTISHGAGRPVGMWVDQFNTLYVANISNKLPASVTEFQPRASAPFQTITQFKGQPGSVAVDKQGFVYVNENVADEDYVQVFAPGFFTAQRTIDTGVSGYALDPGNMAFDPAGNLIVAVEARLQLHVVEIARNSSTVTPLGIDVTNMTGPGLGTDAAGDIYIANESSVAVFAPGSMEPTRTITTPANAGGLISVLDDGTIYEPDAESEVFEIAPGASSPTTVFQCQCQSLGVAVIRSFNPF